MSTLDEAAKKTYGVKDYSIGHSKWCSVALK
jgi:hypothetical protein